jgi:SNF2 family DNA or RNA helicase
MAVAAPPRINPEGLTRTPLWAHQIDALHFMQGKPGVLLAHEMGAGKSLTTIARLEQLRAMRVLVLCPRSVTAVWGDQIRQHATRTWETWAGEVRGARGPRKNPPVSARAAALVRANANAIKLDRPFIAAVNYEASIAKPMPDLLAGTDWDAVILDESHRIKSPGGKQSRLAARICQRVRNRGGHIIALTGTPMSHSPLDLYAQLRALDGGATLGTNYQGFCKRYGAAKTIYAAGGVQRLIYEGLRDGMRDEFAERVAPVVHQAAPDLGLHDVRDVYRTFELTGKAQRVYDSLERHGIAQLEEGVVTAANAMVVVTRLAQCTGGYATDSDTGHSHPIDDTPGKAKLLADVLADIPDEDGPVVVFCRFRSDLDAVQAVAGSTGRTYAELSGRRRDALDGPRLADGVQLAGVQIKSGGTGIDLTAARHGIYYSLGFELAEYEQSRKRLHRPGQTRHVVLTHLLAEGTIDRAIYGALRKRGQVIDAVLDHLQSIDPKGTP